MLLIKNIDVYAPEALGVMDVLIGGGKILKIEKDLSEWSDLVTVIEGKGKKAFTRIHRPTCSYYRWWW